jgi:MYXO-CTERM domain-containing protein
MTITSRVVGSGGQAGRWWRGVAAGLVALLVLVAPAASFGAVYSYVDWTAADTVMGTASGTITLPDNSTVTVTFAAINPDGTAGNLFGAQVDGVGTNYWNPSAPYISADVENAPPGTDILQLSGGVNQVYKVMLSEPIKDPIMAIVSLGQPGVRCTYDFDSPFTIVSQGPGFWGGTDMSLKQLPDDILEGFEGHGTIRFVGTFSTFSWTVPTPESWHGFTFAIRTTERIEPTVDAGADATEGGPVDAEADAAFDAAEEVTPAPVDAAVDATPRTGSSGGCSCSLNTTAPATAVGLAIVLALGASAALRSRRRPAPNRRRR